MIFEKIDYKLDGNNLKLSAECNGVLAIVELSKDRLIDMFPNEFEKFKFVPARNGNSSYFIPVSGEISIEDWMEEYMNQNKAEQMFSDAKIDDITEVITND